MGGINNPMMIGGYRVIIEKPYKTFKKKLGIGKLKKRRKNIRFRVFTGWQTIIQDGTILKNEIAQTIHMNDKTWHQVRLVIEQNQRQSINNI